MVLPVSEPSARTGLTLTTFFRLRREVDEGIQVATYSIDDAAYDELVGHCEKEHEATLDALASMTPSEINRDAPGHTGILVTLRKKMLDVGCALELLSFSLYCAVSSFSTSAIFTFTVSDGQLRS